MACITVDIGGTTCKVALFHSPKGASEPIATTEFSVIKHSAEQPGDFEKDYFNLLRACQRLGAQSYDGIEGVGLAAAGKVSIDRSRLVMAGNLAHWVGPTFPGYLSNDLGCKVVLGNDAEASALADAVYGLGTQDEYRELDFLGMIWGSGVGGACVRYTLDGEIITIPGEPGHVTIDSNGVPFCVGCDDPGHLEAYCGGNNLPPEMKKPTEEFNESDWQDWRYVRDKMATGLKSILAAQPVSLIVFSGGVACKQSWLLPELEVILDEPRYGHPKLRLSAFGESAGSLGALSLLWPLNL